MHIKKYAKKKYQEGSRSCHPEVTGIISKHLQWVLFLKHNTLLQVFSSKILKDFQNSYSVEHLWKPVSGKKQYVK